MSVQNAEVVYYALGGGHGHAMRGIATLKALGYGTLVVPRRLRDWAESLGVFSVSPKEPYRRETGGEWFRKLPSWHLLLVDVFPRGVLGEIRKPLSSSKHRCWLVSRWVRSDYYLDPAIRVSVEKNFQRLVWTESPPPGLRDLDIAQHEIPPVLLEPPPISRSEARQQLEIPDGRRWIMVVGTGERAHQERWLRLCEKIVAHDDIELRFFSDILPSDRIVRSLFPASTYFEAADVVIAAGGYHCYHELQAAAVHAIFVPQSRRYDDQDHRVRGERVARSPQELVHHIQKALASPRPQRRELPDGAQILAEEIKRELEGERKFPVSLE